MQRGNFEGRGQERPIVKYQLNTCSPQPAGIQLDLYVARIEIRATPDPCTLATAVIAVQCQTLQEPLSDPKRDDEQQPACRPTYTTSLHPQKYKPQIYYKVFAYAYTSPRKRRNVPHGAARCERSFIRRMLIYSKLTWNRKTCSLIEFGWHGGAVDYIAISFLRIGYVQQLQIPRGRYGLVDCRCL